MQSKREIFIIKSQPLSKSYNLRSCMNIPRNNLKQCLPEHFGFVTISFLIKNDVSSSSKIQE